MRKVLILLSAVFLISALPAMAQDSGRHSGFDSDTDATQGNSGKENTNANPDNEGQTVEETTGPKGQLKQGNDDCNNCETEVIDLPGANR
jgi:hypothetical protein